MPPEICEYSHDVSTGRFDDISGTEWSCPHPATEGRERCVFHRTDGSPGSKDDTIREAVRENGDGDSADALRFLGAEVGSLALQNTRIRGPHTFPLDFRDARIEGDVVLRRSDVDQPVLLDGAVIEGRIDCTESTFGYVFSLSAATVGQSASFVFSKFGDVVRFDDAVFCGDVDCSGTVFGRGVAGDGASFLGESKFTNTNFEELASFRGANFGGFADFDGPDFHLDARFDESVFYAPAFFETATFEQVAVFRGVVFGEAASFRNAGFTGRASFQQTAFESTALFPGAAFDQRAVFEGTTFGGRVDCREAAFKELQFTPTELRLETPVANPAEPSTVPEAVAERGKGPRAAVDFRGSTVRKGRVAAPAGADVVELSDATVGDVTLSTPDDVSLVDTFRLLNVTYDGFQFHSISDRLRETRYRLVRDDGDGREPSALESTYRKAKDGASRVGDTKTASEFFRIEMRYRRAQYARRVGDGERTVQRRGIAAGRWVANTVLSVTAGYGEKPSRTVTTSVVTILSFAVFYHSVGVFSDGAGFTRSLLLSTQSFVTFLLGSTPASTGLLTQFVTAVEGFLGAFLVALFVFTLTRTIHR